MFCVSGFCKDINLFRQIDGVEGAGDLDPGGGRLFFELCFGAECRGGPLRRGCGRVFLALC